MPLTAKEKMWRYRERLKENRERGDSIKKKDKETKGMKKIMMTTEENLVELQKNRERVAKHRRNVK
jgi:hypothetical protein